MTPSAKTPAPSETAAARRWKASASSPALAHVAMDCSSSARWPPYEVGGIGNRTSPSLGRSAPWASSAWSGCSRPSAPRASYAAWTTNHNWTSARLAVPTPPGLLAWHSAGQQGGLSRRRKGYRVGFRPAAQIRLFARGIPARIGQRREVRRIVARRKYPLARQQNPHTNGEMHSHPPSPLGEMPRCCLAEQRRETVTLHSHHDCTAFSRQKQHLSGDERITCSMGTCVTLERGILLGMVVGAAHRLRAADRRTA